jgi:putative ABC transport system permease protein
VMALVLVEALLLGALGGAVGLGLGAAMIRILPKLPMIGDAVAQFPNLGLSPQIAAVGFAIALMIGLLAGLVPALSAYRARITEALRTV